MAGFCRRCGDIIRGADTRCKCGGSSASSQVSRALFEPTKPDRWLKTYGEKRSSSPAAMVSAGRVPSRAQSTQPLQVARHPASRTLKSSTPASATDALPTTSGRPSLSDRSLNTLPLHVVTPPTPFKQPQSPQLDPTPKRGLSVKNSARAHIRSLTANMPDSVDLSAAEEEVLTNVFGSVLDPHETRGRCGLCSEVFKREGKIFPDPRREEPGGEWAGVFYCRPCYTKAFSRGTCASCRKVVVGDEGFIQLGKGGGRGLWHKKCFRCVHCKTDVSGSPSVDLQGEPCCDDCFDRPTRGILSPSSVTDIPDLRHKPVKHALKHSPATKVMRPAVEELRSKLQKAGIEKAPAAAAPTLSSSASTSAVPTPGLQFNPRKSTSMHNIGTLPKPPDPSSPTRPLRPVPRTTNSNGLHVLSPSANPMCPKCSLPLFASITRGAATLATLPTTGETYHLDCLTCDGCNGAFKEGKYTLLDNEKLCEVCVARRDVAEAEARVKSIEASWKRSAAEGKGQGVARSEVGRSFPTSPVILAPALLAKKVSGSPFLGGQGSEQPKMTGPVRFGGQSICPGCLKPGTIQETKVGPKNERWHTKCLKCGGCGKALDSGAKRFEGAGRGVGCRDCLDKERVSLRAGRM